MKGATNGRRARAVHGRRGRLALAGLLFVASVSSCALAAHAHEAHLFWVGLLPAAAWVWVLTVR